MKIIINLGREILLLGSVRESIMKPSETSSGKNNMYIVVIVAIVEKMLCVLRGQVYYWEHGNSGRLEI
jgi:hypothetical protein